MVSEFLKSKKLACFSFSSEVNNVQKSNLTKALFSALLLTSTIVCAEQNYPAADFQPTVVYQDADYIAKSGQSEAAKPAPVKITTTAATAPAHHADDAKYPAANFQPQVIFNDTNYKHSDPIGSGKGSKSSKVDNVSSSVEEVESAPVPTVAKKKDDSSTYLFGIIGLAAVGFFLFRGKEKCPVKKAISSHSSADTAESSAKQAGLTGVARYLNKKSGTGVSRYLEKNAQSNATGVAKYMARQAVARATKQATGVEKYVRDRG